MDSYLTTTTSDNYFKNAWKRPGSKFARATGIIAILGLGFVFCKYLLPVLVAAAANVLVLAAEIVGLIVVFYIFTNKDFRRNMSLLWLQIMRKLYGLVVNIDPINILQNSINEMIKKYDIISTSVTKMERLLIDMNNKLQEYMHDLTDLEAKIVEALLWANSEMSSSNTTYNEVCKAFASEFNVPLDEIVGVGEKINFATLQDNINWFDLNGDYRGVTGSSLYSKMSVIYGTLGLAKSTLSWNKISDCSVIDALSEHTTLTNNQEANGTKDRTFTAPTKEVQVSPVISNKKVIINFPVNGYTLDADAQHVIEYEFLPIVKQFNNVYVRIEGNTDNTGNYAYNVELSRKRAQAVADWLVRLGMDKNRFIIQGNGPDHAIADHVSGSNENYRTTDLMLIAE